MSVELSPETLVALDAAVRRAIADVETCAAQRRAHAERIRSRWRGGRRADFEVASAELEATARRAVGDLHALRRVTARLGEGGR
jgi:hypothetical protein